MGGSSDKAQKTSKRLGLPVDLIEEAEGFSKDDVTYFPDNADVVSLFSDMLTQWRVGANGPTGLDYSALPTVFRIRGIGKKKRGELFDLLKVMEAAALNFLRKVPDDQG